MFNKTLRTHFPNFLPESEFIKKSHKALTQMGFTAKNTIPCVGVCRDEITHSLIDHVERKWGASFNLSSLAGMVFMGKTGLGAAQAHSPIENGKERYIFVVMPHIAIDADGVIGNCFRAGRPAVSGACGALMKFQGELHKDTPNFAYDPLDIEQSLLEARLLPDLTDKKPDLVTLTKVAANAIVADLEVLIEQQVDTATSDYAVLNGIQIHGPALTQYVHPNSLYAVVNGERHAIDLA